MSFLSKNQHAIGKLKGGLEVVMIGASKDIQMFNYKVYVNDLRKSFPQANHMDETLSDHFDEDAQYVTEIKNNNIVGSCRINKILKNDYRIDDLEVRYEINSFYSQSNNVFFVSRLLIQKEYRNTMTMLKLLKKVYNRVKIFDDFIIVIDCSHSLVSMYEKLGFRTYKNGFLDEVLGQKVPMYFSYGNKLYLRSISSPVLNW